MRFLLISFLILFSITSFSKKNGSIKIKTGNTDVKMKRGGKKKSKSLKVFKRKKKEDKKEKKFSQQDFIKKKEIQKLNIIENQIKNTQEIVEDMDDEYSEKPLYMRKLAELYRKKAKGLWLKGMSFDDIEPKNDKDAERLKKQKTKHLLESNQTTQKAVDTYEDIYKRFPQYEELDLILFFWASTLEEMKQSTMAAKVYKKLAKDFPESKFIPDAFLALGEYYFTSDAMEIAKKAYSKVIQYTDSELYNYAFYKLGWCEFNLRNLKKAFKIFVEILKTGDPNEKFIEQVKMDLVFIYSQFASPDNAPKIFKGLFGDPDYLEYLDKLAFLYKDKQGKREESIYVFNKLLELESDEIKLLKYHVGILDASVAIGKLRNLIRSVLNTSSYMLSIKKNYKDDREFKKHQDILEEIIKELATNYHKQAQETHNDIYYKIAWKFYNEYQKLFRGYEDFYPLLFQYAQLLDEDLGRQEDAIDIYIDIITSKEGKNRENLVEDSVNNALAIYADLILQEKAKKKNKKSNCHNHKNPKPQQLTRRQDQFVKLVDIFIQHNPKSKEIPAAKYNSAKIYYENCHFKKAIPVFEEILTKYVGSDPYEAAASLTLDLLNKNKEYTKMLSWIKRFLKNKKYFSKSFLKQLQNNIEALAFMSPKELEDKKSFIDAAKAYYEFYEKYPKSNRAFYALFNSSLMYENAGDLLNTIKVREEIIKNKKYQKRKERKDVLFYLAQNYQGLTRFEEAADLYNQYQKSYNDKNRIVALKTAIEFYEAIGSKKNLKKANDLIDRYIKIKRLRGKKAYKWDYRKGENIEKTKNWKDIVKYWAKFEKEYNRYISADDRIALQFKIGKAYDKLGIKKSAFNKYKSGFKYYEKLNKNYKKRIKKSKKLLAEYRFNKLENIYNQFRSIKLLLPQRKMAKALKKKIALRKTLIKNYNDAALEFKNAYWSIAFFFKIAQLTYDFAKDIENSPIPKSLTKDQKEMYKQDLMQMYVFPLEQEAFKSYYQVYKIAMKNQIFNEWVDKSIEMMLKIDSTGFKNNFEEQYATVDFQDVLFEKSLPSFSIKNSLKEGNKK